MTREYKRRELVSGVAGRAGKSYADGGPHLAGAIGFRVLFSVFPLMIVLGGLLGIIVNAAGLQADLVDAIVEAFPLDESGNETFRELIEGATGTLTGLGLLGIIGLIWSASGMMGAIRFGLDRAFGASRKRPFVRGKLIDISLVFGVGVLIGLALGLAVTVRLLEAFAADTLDEAGVTRLFTWLIGFAVPAILAFVAVAVLYHVVPASRPSWRIVMPASALVGVAYAVLQNLFALYLSYFGNFNAVYGSLGAMIAFLFFVYLSATLFLLGAYAAAYVPIVRAELERGERPEREPQPPLERAGELVKGLFVYDDAEDEDEERAHEEDSLEP